MDLTSFVVAEMGCNNGEYDGWLTTLTEAFARLDVLQTAVTELYSRCENEDVNSAQVIEVLEKHGAISPSSLVREHSYVHEVNGRCTKRRNVSSSRRILPIGQ